MNNAEIKELIEAKFSGLHAQMKANCDITDIVHQEVKRINGNVRELQNCSIQHRIYWRWAIPGVVILFLLLYIIAEISGVSEILKLII